MCAAKILFELTGSIAAWKACAVISRLVQEGHEVQTVATPSALRFVGAVTLEGLSGRPVKNDLWTPGAAMDHINLVKWADVVVICPATAHTINRLAAGMADDLSGALFLAHDWRKPLLLAPAMNPAMWAHPATVAAVEKLRGWGVRVLPVSRGRLACGDEGEGRLIEPDEILAAIRGALPASAQLPPAGAARRVLITSGGTEEPIDGVRALGNFSTGRTGALLAETLAAAGHEITLLRSRRSAAPPPDPRVREETYVTFAELEGALQRLLAAERFDAVIHAAAVGDYAVAELRIDGHRAPAGTAKLPSGREVSVQLRPTPKLIDRLRAWSANPAIRVVGFKLTRGADADAARQAVADLLAHAPADWVVHNDLEKRDEATGRFPATVWSRTLDPTPVASREELAVLLERLIR